MSKKNTTLNCNDGRDIYAIMNKKKTHFYTMNEKTANKKQGIFTVTTDFQKKKKKRA